MMTVPLRSKRAKKVRGPIHLFGALSKDVWGKVYVFKVYLRCMYSRTTDCVYNQVEYDDCTLKFEKQSKYVR